MTPEIWKQVGIQAIGIVGLVLLVLSFQCKRNRPYYILQGLGSGCFMVQFFFLGPEAAPGAFLNIVNLARGGVFVAGDRLHKWYVFALLQAASVAVIILTYVGWLSFLVAVSELTATTVMWTRNGKTIRLATAFCVSPCNLVYDAVVKSLGGVLCEAFCITSIVVSILRFGVNGFETEEVRKTEEPVRK